MTLTELEGLKDFENSKQSSPVNRKMSMAWLFKNLKDFESQHSALIKLVLESFTRNSLNSSLPTPLQTD